MTFSSYTSYNQGENTNFDSVKKQIGRAALRKVGFHGQLTQAKLEKAVISILGVNDKVENNFTVQFNPSEYTVTRNLKVDEHTPVGVDTDVKQLKASRGCFAVFKTDIYVDTITDFDDAIDTSKKAWKKTADAGGGMVKKIAKTALANYMSDHDQSCSVAANEITDLIKYARDQHRTRIIEFSWGDFSFKGFLTNCTQSYTMFLPNGTPVRSKMSLTIKGEEKSVLQKRSANPFESPDRTKQRTLVEGDQLWMMAYDEYSDPSMWKVIAKENGILNPRLVTSAMDLKVPAII